ncbi:MAG TPA: transglycosylase SLT domain-containing protein [Bosea sp. (in: a-proteobacteria)]|jgi:soluble lytic murein transglycosylase-like protein|uniref:transglycosylase SLT domain-containing protein n=1 Tax=Bosea sp. (in: a-proteobacteria) TaxID=1871050 RepID=UPI002E0F76E4|nr:transglycosylase SLT domain-containing protein [Bosea sp. (in: a-proteobacteria)]
MRYICSGAGAALAICLATLQPALATSAMVNDETDIRALIVRDAEIRRAKEAGEAGADRAGTAAAASTTAAAGHAKAGRPVALAAPAGSDGLRALVARHAAANGVPFSLADAIVRVESRYNPRASHAGNYGLMQIRHQTARGMGYSGGAGGLLDAETNARYAMKYLAMAYRAAGGDTCRTIMKYQSGHMAERMSGANRTYCAKVRTITARN